MLKRILRMLLRHPIATLFVVVCLSLIGFAVATRSGAEPDDARIAAALAGPMALTGAFAEFGVTLNELAGDDETREALGDDTVVLANHDPEGFDPTLSSKEGYVTVFVFPSEGERERHEAALVGDAARVFSRANVIVLYAPGLRDLSVKIGELVPPISPHLDVIPEP